MQEAPDTDADLASKQVGSGKGPWRGGDLRRLGLTATLAGGVLLFGACEPGSPDTLDLERGPDGQWHDIEVEEPPAHPTELEDAPLFSERFPAEEFEERRAAVLEEIGTDGLAILQGAPSPMGFVEFRQSNEFYYLTGIEAPHAYLLLDGAAGEAHVYLRPRDEGREFGEGKVPSPQDGDLISERTGIENVHSFEDLPGALEALAAESVHERVHAPLAPPELRATTRGMANRTFRDRGEDPLDNRPPRHQAFQRELRDRLPGMELRDLTPALDDLRLTKSERELEKIRASTRLHGLAILDVMRATAPGITEYEMEAVARYRFWQHDAQGSAYYALAHIGPHAYMNHYHGGVREAGPGDMLLLDYGADYGYYVSDMGRMWPADGHFNDVQRELYGFYLEFYEAILDRIRPGVTAHEIMMEAVKEHERLVEDWEFSKEIYEEAARDFVDSYRARAENPDAGLGHWVGMAAHDPGTHTGPLEPGMVFVIEPQFRVPEEQIYIRLEDTIAITEDGVEIFSDFVPRDMESIARLVRQRGLLQDYPELMAPDGTFLAPGEALLE